MSCYYDRQGKPMEMMDWVRDFEGQGLKRRVAYDKLPNGVSVSTVWLGLDHAFGGGPPLIFETLVFEGPMDGEMYRYSTEAQALAGHAAMLARVKAAAKRKKA